MDQQDATIMQAVRAAATDDGRMFSAATMRIIVGIVDAQAAKLDLIKGMLQHAGCADWTDDPAEMLKAYLEQEKE